MDKLTWIITLQLCGIVIYLSKLFIVPYLTERGKNAATKADIGEITDIVESIKADLLRQTEALKAQISLKSEHQMSVRAAERDALITYFKSTKKIITAFTSFNFLKYDENNYDDLNTLDEYFQPYFFEQNGDEALVHLYNPDQELDNIHSKIVFMFIELRLLLSVAGNDIRVLYMGHRIRHPGTGIGPHDEYKKMRNNVSERINQFADERLLIYKRLMIEFSELENFIRNRLTVLGSI